MADTNQLDLLKQDLGAIGDAIRDKSGRVTPKIAVSWDEDSVTHPEYKVRRPDIKGSTWSGTTSFSFKFDPDTNPTKEINITVKNSSIANWLTKSGYFGYDIQYTFVDGTVEKVKTTLYYNQIPSEDTVITKENVTAITITFGSSYSGHNLVTTGNPVFFIITDTIAENVQWQYNKDLIQLNQLPTEINHLLGNKLSFEYVSGSGRFQIPEKILNKSFIVIFGYTNSYPNSENLTDARVWSVWQYNVTLDSFQQIKWPDSASMVYTTSSGLPTATWKIEDSVIQGYLNNGKISNSYYYGAFFLY